MSRFKEKPDWCYMHDIILDLTGKSVDDTECEKVFYDLPEGIKSTAFEWGMNDTVFRDNAFVHLRDVVKIARMYEKR